jgi:hypothetical protein
MYRRCLENGCNIKQPIYNYEGETYSIYCATHKKDGMVDVKHKKCLENTCNIIPSYNYEGEKKGQYCATHKKEKMIDVINNNCIENGCNTKPNYNYKKEKQALYCAKHKKDNMVNVTSKSCLEEECNIRPTYNYEGEKQGIYCTTHKKDRMVNVKDKKCLEDGCNIRPSYNYINKTTSIYCTTHKKEGMVNVKDKKCLENNCNIIPNYNYKGEKQALYCVMHKKNEMINIKSSFCKTPLCHTQVTNKYEGYCIRCFIYLFPDRPNSRNYKTKEKATSYYIIEQFPIDKYTWITDKKIQDGCSRRRPDLLLDLGYQVIIVEVDENQHESYDCSCENKRLMLLSQDIGHRPLVFIRFNPDDYLTKDGKVTSCWGLNKNGICTVKKSKKKEWSQRLEVLKEQIKYWLENKTEKTIEIIQLFYDCN